MYNCYKPSWFAIHICSCFSYFSCIDSVDQGTKRFSQILLKGCITCPRPLRMLLFSRKGYVYVYHMQVVVCVYFYLSFFIHLLYMYVHVNGCRYLNIYTYIKGEGGNLVVKNVCQVSLLVFLSNKICLNLNLMYPNPSI